MLALTRMQSRICSVWDMNEVVRLQLFEKRPAEVVRLMGEFKSTHREILANFADGIQQVWNFVACTCRARRLGIFVNSGMQLQLVLQAKVITDTTAHISSFVSSICVSYARSVSLCSRHRKTF